VTDPAPGPPVTVPPARGRFLRLLAVTVLFAAGLRLAGFVVRFGADSVQSDFAAFYTAGEAVALGLSPYRTHAHREPPVWDGVDVYQHSRFLYPPLVASSFRPLAALPYSVAKRLWMLVSLACVAYAVTATLRAVGARPGATALLALGAFVALYHPLLALLERGQVDAMTLALMVAAFRPLVAEGRERLASGVLLALATLLKLNVVYVVPFLALRRRWRVLAGYALGGAALALVSLLVDGPQALAGYAARELPRIAAHGENGTTEMLLPADVLDGLRGGRPPGRTVKDGREYAVESFGFVANASLARVVSARAGGHRHAATASLAILALLCAGLLLSEGRRAPSPPPHDPTRELVHWQVVLVAILLAGPLTWAMNVVWLLPAAVVLVHRWSHLADPREAAALAGLAAGLLLAAIPDQHTLTVLAPYGDRVLTWKYVVAELVVLGSLLPLARRPAS
jgi:hypothetical protein